MSRQRASQATTSATERQSQTSTPASLRGNQARPRRRPSPATAQSNSAMLHSIDNRRNNGTERQSESNREVPSTLGMQTAPAPVSSAQQSVRTTPQAGQSAVNDSPPQQEQTEVPIHMPEPLPGPSSEEQRRLSNVRDNARGTADTQQAMAPANEQIASVQAAVNQPQEEVEGLAEAELLAQMYAQTEPSPEILEICDNLKNNTDPDTNIENRRPSDEEELIRTNPREEAEAVGSLLENQVSDEAEAVNANYQQVNAETNPATPAQGEALVTPDLSVASPDIRANQAAPDEPEAESLSLEADVSANAQRMADAGMTGPVADAIDTGPIAEARSAHSELESTAQRDPEAVLAELNGQRDEAASNMRELQMNAVASMLGSRRDTATQLGSDQLNAVRTEEQMRIEASRSARENVASARRQVNEKIDGVVTAAMEKWDSEIAVITARFESDLQSVKDAISDRQSGVIGAVVEIWDDITGLPDWIIRKYDFAERRFVNSVCRVLRTISRDVNLVVTICERLIDNAHRENTRIFGALPENLQTWAEAEQQGFANQLNELQDSVYSRRDQFNSSVGEAAQGAVEEARARVNELREQAKGLLQRAYDAIEEFADDPVRFLINGLLEQVGIAPEAFWQLINRISTVISDIAADPWNFAGNLASALHLGFSQFFDRISTHLSSGFFNWLFSGLGAVGVELPQDFTDPKQIVTFFLGLMGISWEKIRRLIARQIGPRNVAALEKAYELIEQMIVLGPQGIYELLKAQLDPRNLLNIIKDAAMDALIEMLVRQSALLLAKFTNPGGLVVAAIELIYTILSWLFNNAARIFSLVETVVGGATDLIAGNIRGMASAIENALALSLVPVIDFVATYFGLGNLPDRIADVIKGFQDAVENILDRIITFIANRARSLLRSMRGSGPRSNPHLSGDGEGEDTELGATQQFTGGGERHRIWIQRNGRNATVMMASQPAPLADQLSTWRSRLPELEGDAERHPQAEQKLRTAEEMLAQTDSLSDALAADWEVYVRGRDRGDRPPPDDDALEEKEQRLVGVLRELLEIFGESAETTGPDKIIHRTRNLQGHQVGIEMVADPLTKKSASLGSVPQSGEQDALMGMLNTATSGLNNRQFFLRGHLLNHNVGGVGRAKNLFPITGAANKAHLQSIETKVKGWVDEGRTVSYSVKVTDVDANLRHDKNTAERRKNKVNAKFRVQATVKQKGNKPAETIRPSPIVSRYDEPSEAAFLGAQSGSGRQTFRLSEKSINELKSLNGVTAAIARKMKSEADKGTSRISSYERLFGISKENLDSANPGFRLLW